MVFILQTDRFLVVRFIARRVVQDYLIYLLNIMRCDMFIEIDCRRYRKPKKVLCL